jgi:hypothetical protein
MRISTRVRAEVLRNTAFLIALAMLALARVQAQIPGQNTLTSSKEALAGFIHGVRSNDTASLQSILGAGSAAIISFGDSAADKAARDSFLAKYDVKYALVESGSHQFTLNVGADDWPLPIPLVDNAGKWYFDGAAGQQEIVYAGSARTSYLRSTFCKGVVAAQDDYAASSHDGHSAGLYAERVVSDAGKQNGLYWETKSGEQ